MQGAPVQCATAIYLQALVLKRDIGTIVYARHYLDTEQVSAAGRDPTAVELGDADTFLEQFCLPPQKLQWWALVTPERALYEPFLLILVCRPSTGTFGRIRYGLVGNEVGESRAAEGPR